MCFVSSSATSASFKESEDVAAAAASDAVVVSDDDEDGSEGVAATSFLRKLMKPNEYSVRTRQTEMTKASMIVFFF